MTRKLAPFLWQRLYGQAFTRKANQSKGFTLLELLVSLAIGSVIVYVMLFAVVELLKTNQREAARSDTQREVQSALDYIARDLREAVYVYDGNCLRASQVAGCPSGPGHLGLLNYLPPELNQPAAPAGTNNIPVLAFWRVDPLPDQLKKSICEARASDFSQATPPLAIQNIPCISSRMYTLVVYSLRLNPANDPIWKGRARITRYQLPQYGTKLTLSSPLPFTQGWTSPIAKGTNFPSWPLVEGKEPTSPFVWQKATEYSKEVLIDFVDDKPLPGADVSCPNPPTITSQRYFPTPDNTIANGRRGFYTCVNVSQAGLPLQPTADQPNQEVIVYINGNAAGRGSISRDTGKVMIPMETRVLTRGALNKGS